MEVSQKQICNDILDLLGCLKSALWEVAEEQGITPIQLSALYCVGRQGQMPMGKVADALHCDPSNVTGLVDRLVQQQLIIREECSTDRRAKNLRLTPKGEQLMADLHDLLPVRLGCDRLDAQERRTLHELIRKVTVA